MRAGAAQRVEPLRLRGDVGARARKRQGLHEVYAAGVVHFLGDGRAPFQGALAERLEKRQSHYAAVFQCLVALTGVRPDAESLADFAGKLREYAGSVASDE